MPSPASLTIDLAALARNYRTLERIGGAPVHPVVKADAYGLGAVPVARRLMAEGARVFFVARIQEGETLRAGLGPEATIHVLDGCPTGAAGRLKVAGLTPVLTSGAHLAEWRASGGGACAVHIDTGMNRLGFRLDEAPEAFDGIGLVMSHLACADDPAHPMNRRQCDAFAAVAQRYPGALRSLANSGGVFLGPEFAFDVTRPGIGLCGGGPEGRPDDRLAPVVTLSAEVLQVSDVQAGESIGYSQGFVAETPRRVAICAAGYADGVLRSYHPNGAVWLDGGLRPILGRVSMDLIAVDVTGTLVRAGDRAELFGSNRALDDAATSADTIAHEVLSAVTPRVERRYVG